MFECIGQGRALGVKKLNSGKVPPSTQLLRFSAERIEAVAPQTPNYRKTVKKQPKLVLTILRESKLLDSTVNRFFGAF